MITKAEVEEFLKRFYVKVKIFGIRYRDDRDKNRQTLLEIPARMRETVVMSLVADDYSEGPIMDTLNNQGELWVFGKSFDEKEIYIKISLGAENSHTVCISFHEAEHPMNYPLKP